MSVSLWSSCSVCGAVVPAPVSVFVFVPGLSIMVATGATDEPERNTVERADTPDNHAEKRSCELHMVTCT